MPKGNPGIPKSVEHRASMSLGFKHRKYTPEGRLKRRLASLGAKNNFFGHTHTPEVREILRRVNSGRTLPPEVRAKMGRLGESNGFYGKKHSISIKEHLSNVHRTLWEDPEFACRQIRNWHLKPNKGEIALDNLLQTNFPNTWIYNGDGNYGVSIGRRIPDFVKTNGERMVIELFGFLFHRPDLNSRLDISRGEKETIELYQKYGYQCLIVWYTELKQKGQLLHKIQDFLP